jgi:hypothetical protein
MSKKESKNTNKKQRKQVNYLKIDVKINFQPNFKQGEEMCGVTRTHFTGCCRFVWRAVCSASRAEFAYRASVANAPPVPCKAKVKRYFKIQIQ